MKKYKCINRDSCVLTYNEIYTELFLKEKLYSTECTEWIVLHFGDHDPSGVDMTRDVRERLSLFSSPYKRQPRVRVEVKRVALNMDQITQYDPPPNPAKETDSRFAAYKELYGDEDG